MLEKAEQAAETGGILADVFQRLEHHALMIHLHASSSERTIVQVAGNDVCFTHFATDVVAVGASDDGIE